MFMEIEKLEVGILRTNCYILKKEGNILIIDPGDESQLIEKHLNGNILGIIITHYHFDHIGALDSLKNKYNIPVYDINNLKEVNTLGPFTFKMIKTPGHKDDLISLLFEDKLFCGDFIFENGIGRTDLETGDFNAMKDSITKILSMPLDTIIYPGHGNITTLKKEYANLINYTK